MQTCATPRNQRPLTRNEQVSGSSPLVGSPFFSLAPDRVTREDAEGRRLQRIDARGESPWIERISEVEEEPSPVLVTVVQYAFEAEEGGFDADELSERRAIPREHKNGHRLTGRLAPRSHEESARTARTKRTSRVPSEFDKAWKIGLK